MGDKLNQTNNSADNNLGHFFKATDFDDTVVPLWYDFHTAKEPKSHQRGSRISEGWKKL